MKLTEDPISFTGLGRRGFVAQASGTRTGALIERPASMRKKPLVPHKRTFPAVTTATDGCHNLVSPDKAAKKEKER
jgi:hypothetical protein